MSGVSYRNSAWGGGESVAPYTNQSRNLILYHTGEPLDIMRRGILCAGTRELAMKLVPYLQQLSYPV